jgi:S1-C subfamily serine protease
MFEKGLLKKFYDEYTEKENYADDKSALRTVEVVFGKSVTEVEHDWRQWVLAQRVPPVPFLGVRSREDKDRVVVEEVVARSPAEAAGVKAGDVILRLDSQAIKRQSDLMEALGAKDVGEEVALQVQRDGKAIDVKLKLAARPASIAERPAAPPPQTAFLGASVEEAGEGIRVKEVVKDSPAAKAGLKVGDPILELNGKAVRSVRQFLDALKAARPGQTVKLTIVRDGQRRTVEVQLAKLP